MSDSPRSWSAGAATSFFPIPSGTPMSGFMARTGPSTGTLDELTVSALVLTRADSRLVILAADLAGVDNELPNEIASAAGLDRREILLCASHTHSGPAGVISRLHPADDDQLSPGLRARFIRESLKAITDASDRIEPVDLFFGQSETSGLAENRNDPRGPLDPTVSVIAARRPNDELVAMLVHFACHPTILSDANRLISAEFPGALRRSLQSTFEQEGKPPVVLFANGAAGDVSTRFTRLAQDITEVERVGSGLAQAAVTALASATAVFGPIRNERQTVNLPPRSLAEYVQTPKGQANQDQSAAEQRKQITRQQGAALLAKLVEVGPDAIPASFDLEAWSVGEIVLVAVPGELFASLGAQIARDSSTLVVGYANGYIGYLADEAAYAAETYEGLSSPFAPGAGELVVEAGRGLVNRIRTGEK